MSAFTDAWNAAWTADPPDKAAIAALGAMIEDLIDSQRLTDLVDFPDSYAGEGGKTVTALATEDGVEFT